jgi:4-amino-4-deoxy-L-arabinose transferase-like glycosyltransferase
MNIHRTFWLLTSAVFILILLPKLVQDGMFLDGITYAAISKNLANGLGNFWSPQYTLSIDPVFHSHPPLVFFLQSQFFILLGNGIYTERIYTVITALITVAGLLIFWTSLTKGKESNRYNWLIVLLWITIPIVAWSYKNNLLENTLGILTLFSVYLIVRSFQSSKVTYLLFSSSLIFLAFLSKGPVGLFPLATPLIYSISYHNKINSKSLLYFFIQIFILVLSFGILFLLSAESVQSLSSYFKIQIFPALEFELNGLESRFYIVFELLLELALPIIIITIILIKTRQLDRFKKILMKKEAIFSLLTGLSASIPILLSGKQARLYFIPSIPFFIFFFGLLIVPFIKDAAKRLSNYEIKWMQYISWLSLLIIIIYTMSCAGGYSRNKEMIQDIHKIMTIVEPGSRMQVSNELMEDYYLVAYCIRIADISLQTQKSEYLLIKKQQKKEILNSENYFEYDLNLTNYKFYRSSASPVLE